MSIVNVPFLSSAQQLTSEQVLNISVQDNPAKFEDPYNFDITFECLEPLSKGQSPIPFLRDHKLTDA